MLLRSTALRPLIRTSPQSVSNTTRLVPQTVQAQTTSTRRLHLSINNRLKSPHSVNYPEHIFTRAYSTPMAAPTDTAANEVANNTGITPDSLAQTLRDKLDATHVEIQDISGGCGASFTALIVSPQFQGKAALARHRLVNGALKAEIAAIHAWTPKCLTPEQWEQQKTQQ